MHFWIDKRSQCSYAGHPRVPSSLSSGGLSRARAYGAGAGAGAGARKGMAAPVHRFAAVDCPPRRLHRTPRNYGQPVVPVHSHSSRRQGEEASLCVDMPAEPEPARAPPQPTIASLAAARSVTPDTLLRTAALGLHHQSPIMAYHLRCGVLFSFAIASIFLAGAKYYFDKHVQMSRDSNTSGEASVVCAAVACLCGVGCAFNMCRAKPEPLHEPDRVSSTAQRDRRPPPSDPSDDISLTTLLQTPRAPDPPTEAPPPYHIAVLLPGRDHDHDHDPDISPPAYSALS